MSKKKNENATNVEDTNVEPIVPVVDGETEEKDVHTTEPVVQLTKEELAILADARKFGVVPSKSLSEREIIKEFTRVPFLAFKDNDKYNADIHARLNGRTLVIQRGVMVIIPRCIKRIIDVSEKQRVIASAMSSQLEREYREKQIIASI